MAGEQRIFLDLSFVLTRQRRRHGGVFPALLRTSRTTLMAYGTTNLTQLSSTLRLVYRFCPFTCLRNLIQEYSPFPP